MALSEVNCQLRVDGVVGKEDLQKEDKDTVLRRQMEMAFVRMWSR